MGGSLVSSPPLAAWQRRMCCGYQLRCRGANPWLTWFTLRGDTATVARMILVVAATERELAGAAGAATLVCGVGPVEAAAATAGALARGPRPDALLHVGIAGARGIPVAQLVIGSEAVYEDALRRGPRRGRSARPRVWSMRRSARCRSARVLPIGTSARVGGTSSCEVEAMEGFAVLRAARLAVSLRSRCAPFPTRSTSRIERAGASTMRSPRSTPLCRGCSRAPRMKRVWLRAAALALAVVGAVAGLTVYFSTENIPRCLVSGVSTWRPPTDGRTHRYEVVILGGSACPWFCLRLIVLL